MLRLLSIWLLLYQLQGVTASGKIHLQLRSYENENGTDYSGKCCDGYIVTSLVCKPCDFYIFSCALDKRNHNMGPCVSNSFTSEVFNDTYIITFLPGNPKTEFILNFTIPSRFLDIVFSIYDEDKYDVPASQAHLIENASYNLGMLRPFYFTQSPSFSEGNVTLKNGRLTIAYYFQCDEDFYDKCDHYCPSDPEKYTCNSHGKRVCNPGWTGDNCTNFNYCSNQSCMNGGSCSTTTSGITCTCLSDYSGSHCENIMITSSRSVSKSTSTLASTKTANISKESKIPKPTTLFKSTENSFLFDSNTIPVKKSASLSSEPKSSSSLVSSAPRRSTAAVYSSSNLFTAFLSTSVVLKPYSSLPGRTSLSRTRAVGRISNSIASRRLRHESTKSTTVKEMSIGDSKTKGENADTAENLLLKTIIIAGSAVGLLMLLCGGLYVLTRKKKKIVNDKNFVKKPPIKYSPTSRKTSQISPKVEQALDW